MTSSQRVVVGLVGDREHEPLGLDDLAVLALPVDLAAPGSANIVARHEPPGLTSIETVDSGTSASVPPNQSAKRSGSVHSRHTRSRGASKTRVIVMPAQPCRLQALVEAVEASLPERDGTSRASRPRPSAAPPSSRDGRSCAERPRVISPARSSTFRCLETAWTLIGNGSASSFTVASPSARRAEDRAPRRIGERRERARELVDRHAVFISSVYQLSR